MNEAAANAVGALSEERGRAKNGNGACHLIFLWVARVSLSCLQDDGLRLAAL